jgi:hypothetical protein
MGSYSQLTLDGYPIYTVKNGYDQIAVKLLFQPGDFLSEVRPNHSRNPLVWGEGYKDDPDNFHFYGFRQTVRNCLRRLEIYGMSPGKAKANFLKARKSARDEFIYDFPIHRVPFSTYLAEIKYIMDHKLIHHDQIYTNLRDSLVSDELGIAGQSVTAHLYCLLQALPGDATVEYDLTDVIEGGWVTLEDIEEIPTEKIIILTEGKTDVEFIRGAMKILYPELVPHYHFIDFAEYKIESNASALARLVTSFAAANVAHHLVVIFDNDTVGIMEMTRIDQSKLPKNIKVIRLPDTALARKYPTIGPTGPKRMNVNGLACGIEMYAGADVLMTGNQLSPVLWKGYIEKESKYQGELQNKGLIQDKFREKLKKGVATGLEDMNLILQSIFTAFK